MKKKNIIINRWTTNMRQIQNIFGRIRTGNTNEDENGNLLTGGVTWRRRKKETDLVSCNISPLARTNIREHR